MTARDLDTATDLEVDARVRGLECVHQRPAYRRIRPGIEAGDPRSIETPAQSLDVQIHPHSDVIEETDQLVDRVSVEKATVEDADPGVIRFMDAAVDPGEDAFRGHALMVRDQGCLLRAASTIARARSGSIGFDQ